MTINLHFNKAFDRTLVDALLDKFKSCPNNGTPIAVYECTNWRDVVNGWNITVGPYPVYILPKHRPIATEDNVVSVLQQKGSSNNKKSLVSRSADSGESPNRNRHVPLTFLAFHGSVEPGTYRYVPNNGAYRAYKQRVNVAKMFHKTHADSIDQQQQESENGNVSPDGKKNFRLKRYDKETSTSCANSGECDPSSHHFGSKSDPGMSDILSCRSVPLNTSLICLPPLELPLISVSFDYRKIARKVSLWEESLRQDFQQRFENTKDFTRSGQTSLQGSAEEGFYIKSLLHTCSYECDCQKYPEKRKNFESSPKDSRQSSRSKKQSVQSRKLESKSPGARGAFTAALTALRWAAPLPPKAESVEEEFKPATPNCDEVDPGLFSEGSTSNGFCSSALGYRKVREKKTIPSIPKMEPGPPITPVELSGKGLPYLSYTSLLDTSNP